MRKVGFAVSFIDCSIHIFVLWIVFIDYVFCGGVVACNGSQRKVARIRLRWACVEVLRRRANHARAIRTDSNHCCLNSRASVNRISLGRQNHRRSLFASVVYLHICGWWRHPTLHAIVEMHNSKIWKIETRTNLNTVDALCYPTQSSPNHSTDPT
jgi:hypothetical protein